MTSHTNGYTIVETMIFLAISGGLLLVALLFIGGQQRKTQFATAVRDFDSKIQSVISNVATGYYNNAGNTSCTAPGGVITVGNTGTSGQNADCTFIGQVIVPTPVGAIPSGVTIYSTAGLRIDPVTSKEVQSILAAKPVLIDVTKEFYVFNSGVTATMKNLTTGLPFGSLGVFTTFNQYSVTGGLLGSGSTRSDLYAIGATAPPNSNIESALTAGTYQANPSAGIQICLTDGTQVGVILLNNGSTRTSIGNTCP